MIKPQIMHTVRLGHPLHRSRLFLGDFKRRLALKAFYHHIKAAIGVLRETIPTFLFRVSDLSCGFFALLGLEI